MAQGANNIANGQIVTGLGVGARQWTSAFTLTDTDSATALFTVALTGAMSTSALATSTVAAGSDVAKFTATNATPTVAFTDNGGASHAPTTAPAGYLQVNVGGTSYYMPFWS